MVCVVGVNMNPPSARIRLFTDGQVFPMEILLLHIYLKLYSIWIKLALLHSEFNTDYYII